jgi:hypothetical protein
MQWVDIDFFVFSLHVRKNKKMNNIIMISDLHASWGRANIDVANEMNYT